MAITDRGPTLARRQLLAAFAGLGIAAALAGPAAADPVSDAKALVNALSGELDQLDNSGHGVPQIYGDFERIFSRYADMPAVAASVLGPPWRTATPAQQQAFVAAFQSYLSRKYGRQFNEYKDSKITVTGARDAGKAGVLVSTTVVRPGQDNVNVDWQIGNRGGGAKAVNLIIEGVSLLANERAEVGAMLDEQRGSIDGLIAALKQRN